MGSRAGETGRSTAAEKQTALEKTSARYFHGGSFLESCCSSRSFDAPDQGRRIAAVIFALTENSVDPESLPPCQIHDNPTLAVVFDNHLLPWLYYQYHQRGTQNGESFRAPPSREENLAIHIRNSASLRFFATPYRIHGILHASGDSSQAFSQKTAVGPGFFCYSFAYGLTRDLPCPDAPF